MNIDEMNWLHPLLGWQREASDPSDPTEFLDALRFELSSQEVYVLTPKGDVIPLPDGATPVDFAYAVHTEVGHKCIGARVNGKLVPLGSTLSNGDVIEIFTSKSDTAGPSQDWLGFVKSRRARTKIRQYFNKERCEEAIETGKDAIVKARRERHRRGRIDGAGVVVRGVDDRSVGLARCCTPIPGDAVFGFVARSGEVWVHREDCAKPDDLRAQPERMREVTWKPTSASTFLVAIQVEALDRHKLLADITKVLFDERVEVLSATVSTTRDQVAIGRLSFVMADPQHLGHLLAAVRQVDGVYDAYRITSGA